MQRGSGEKLHRKNELSGCLTVTHGNVWAAGPSRSEPEASRHSPHSPPSHQDPGDSPAGQDPDHVAGLVPFNADCTVVKVRLCFLQHRKHTWAYFCSFNSCKDTQITRWRTMTQGQASMVLGSVFLINNLLFTGLVSIHSNLHFLSLGSTASGTIFKLHHYW